MGQLPPDSPTQQPHEAQSGRGSLAPLLLWSLLWILLALMGLAFFAWLNMTVVALSGQNIPLRQITPEWLEYAVRISIGTLAPPALFAGLNLNYPRHRRLYSATCASLITFGIYTILFLLIIRLFAPNPPALVLSMILSGCAPFIMCALLFLSYKLTVFYISPQSQSLPPPLPVNIFTGIVIILLICCLFQGASVFNLGSLPKISASFFRLSRLPQDLFLILAITWGLRSGQRIFRLVWAMICLYEIMTVFPLFGGLPPAWQVFNLARLGLVIAATICLYMPSTRRWLLG